MAVDINGITANLISQALVTGWFESVNGYEPKSKPGLGLTAAFWVADLGPVPSSGLASTSALLTFNMRIYTSMLQEPQDAIDPQLISAVDEMMINYTGEFTLGGTVRNIDVFGAHGTPLRAITGYLEQGGTVYRVATLTIPIIVNDLWNQIP